MMSNANVDHAIESMLDRSKWQKIIFSDLVENIVEKVKPKESGLEKYIGLKHLDSGSLHIRRFGETSTIDGDKLKIYKGDLVFAKRNSYLKRVAIADFDAVVSAHSLVLRAKSTNVRPEFLPFFLLSDTFWQRAIEISVGSLSPTINWRVLAKQEFLFPPLDQQAKLAELFWAIDDVVAEHKRIVDSLDAYFQAWLNKSINTKKGWKTSPLHKVADVQTGVAKNRNIAEQDDAVELPYIRVANVQDGYLVLDDIKKIHVKSKDVKRFSLESGDLLLTEGGDFDKLGRGYVWQGEIAECLHQNHVFAVRPNKKLITSWFLSLVTRSAYGKQYFLRCAKKTSNLASINSSQLKEFRVFTPTLKEQNLIEEEMKAFFKSSLNASTTLESSESLQQSLINQVF